MRVFATRILKHQKAWQRSAVILLFVTTAVHAQDYRGLSEPVNPALPRQVYWSQHHASTFEEGLLRGQSDLVSSRGEAFRNWSIGFNYLQEAIHKALRNDVANTKRFFDKRAINRVARYAKADQRAARRLNQQATASKRHKQPVSPFEPGSDVICWPVTLQEARYAQAAQSLDDLFSKHNPYDGGLGSQLYHTVRQECEKILARLRLHIRNLPTKDYLHAKRLVTSLVSTVETAAIERAGKPTPVYQHKRLATLRLWC